MAEFKYSNSRNPKLVLRLTIGVILLCLGLFLIGTAIDSESGWTLAAQIAYTLAMCFYSWGVWKSQYCIIDDEKRIIFNGDNRKYPIEIDKISHIIMNESKKGKFRFILVHDTGVKFIKVPTRRSNAEKIKSKILELNPSVEVRITHYL